MKLTTKIARVRIGDDLWQSGDGILLPSISIELGEDNKSSRCSFEVYDPGLTIGAKYRAMSLTAGGILVPPELAENTGTTGSAATPTDAAAPASGGTGQSNDGYFWGYAAAYSPSDFSGLTARGKQCLEALKNPNTRAFLDAIAAAELHRNAAEQPSYGYGYVFGDRPGKETLNPNTMTKHPRIRRPFGRSASSATGRYQTMDFVWDEEAPRLGLKDFKPQSQEVLAVSRLLYRGILETVKNGDFNGAIEGRGSSSARYEWASLEGNPYGQGTSDGKRSTFLAYAQQRKQAAGGQVAPTPPPPPMQPTPPEQTEIKQTAPPQESSAKGTEIIVEMAIASPDFNDLVAFHFIHTGTSSHKDRGKEITKFAGQSVRFLLSRVRQTNAKQDITLKEFAEQIANGYGLKLEMEGDGMTYKYLPQEGQTPYEILQRECTRLGYRITDEKDSNKLIIKPAAKVTRKNFVVTEEHLISVEFTDSARSSTPTPVQPVTAADPNTTAASGSTASINQVSGAMEQQAPDSPVGTPGNGGTTGPAAPAPQPTTTAATNCPPAANGDINARILAAYRKLGAFSTRQIPGTLGGSVACAAAVNKVLSEAGLRALGGANPYGNMAVLGCEAALKGGRGQRVDASQAIAGDLTLVDAGGNRQHIGICLNNGCTRTISNSTSRASFSWTSNQNFADYSGSPYRGTTARIYRVLN